MSRSAKRSIVCRSRAELNLEFEQDFYHPYLTQSSDKQSIFDVFNFMRLPLDVRDELALLLLLPFGALITAFFRHLIGVDSYGVFTATLLALALIYANPVTTLIIVTITCSLAIAGRSLLPAKLSQTPRLAIIFTLVAIFIAISMSLLHYLEFEKDSMLEFEVDV